jgi:hypothetical protein
VFTLAFSGQANAEWFLNGIMLHGTNMQATKLQGMVLQNLKVEGGQLVAVTRVSAQ